MLLLNTVNGKWRLLLFGSFEFRVVIFFHFVRRVLLFFVVVLTIFSTVTVSSTGFAGSITPN